MSEALLPYVSVAMLGLDYNPARMWSPSEFVFIEFQTQPDVPMVSSLSNQFKALKSWTEK
jgi:hypothetical protein